MPANALRQVALWTQNKLPQIQVRLDSANLRFFLCFALKTSNQSCLMILLFGASLALSNALYNSQYAIERDAKLNFSIFLNFGDQIAFRKLAISFFVVWFSSTDFPEL